MIVKSATNYKKKLVYIFYLFFFSFSFVLPFSCFIIIIICCKFVCLSVKQSNVCVRDGGAVVFYVIYWYLLLLLALGRSYLYAMTATVVVHI